MGLKKIYKKFNLFFRLLQPIIDFKKLLTVFPGYYKFLKDYYKFKKQFNGKILKRDFFPCLNDNTENTGFDRHYIYHLSWAARILNSTKPQIHTDISSSLYFCSIVSAFINIKFYDYRPAIINLSNLSSEHADLLKLQFPDASINSLSCMHTVEHVGLGRYGDPVDPFGDIKAINELKRVLAVNGDLLFVVPVGKSKIMFNAHRIYSYSDIMRYFDGFDLIDFSLVPDDKALGFINNAGEKLSDSQNYGCGCFWFKKR